jgi:hypothetical protein
MMVWSECQAAGQHGEGILRMPEVGTVAGTALLVMILAMWATRPPASCILPSEPHRHLVLERVVDSEHLASDVRETARIARRYGAHMAAAQAKGDAPPTTSVLDGVAEQCEARLASQLMTTHDVSLDQVHAATSHDR